MQGGTAGGAVGAVGGSNGGDDGEVHVPPLTATCIVNMKTEVACCGVYLTRKLDVSEKVSVTTFLLCSWVSSVADMGSGAAVPSPLKMSSLRSTWVSGLRDDV